MSGEQLERRYRGLLRVLPRPYREARGEELLSVLMDGATGGRRWPDAREVLSLAWLGLRLRVRGAAAGLEGGGVEPTRLGEMSRLAGILGSVILTFMGVTQLAITMRILKNLPGYKPWRILNPFGNRYDGINIDFPYLIAHYEAPSCWLFVLMLLSIGWWGAARVLAVVVFLVSAYLTTDMRAAMAEETLLAAVTTAALFGARGPHARALRAPGLVAVAGLIGVMGYIYRTFSGYAGSHELLPRSLAALQGRGATDAGHAVVAVAVVVTVACVVAYRSAVWPAVLAVVSVAAFAPVVVRGMSSPEAARPDTIPLLGLACALVVATGLAVVKERRSQRRAPDGDGEAPAG